MARPHPLRVLMNTPLPPISQQRRKVFRPSIREVHKTYDLINKYVFNNKLKRPKITLSQCRDYWGLCTGLWYPTRSGRCVEIKLSDKWYCAQWMVAVLAHEMVHQYQWEILGRNMEGKLKWNVMNHGPSFYEWRDTMAEYQIPLNLFVMTSCQWFKMQSFDK